MTGGLTKFDDRSENYLSWKATFQSTILDLSLTASEEINLLIKWLGPESLEQKGKSSQHTSTICWPKYDLAEIK